MSIKLTLRTTFDVPLEAEVISPDKFANLSLAEIATLPVYHGNQKASFGRLFSGDRPQQRQR